MGNKEKLIVTFKTSSFLINKVKEHCDVCKSIVDEDERFEFDFHSIKIAQRQTARCLVCGWEATDLVDIYEGRLVEDE